MSPAQLSNALAMLGLQTKYGARRFPYFTAFEFQRTDWDGNGTIEFNEFSGCYRRFLWIQKISKTDEEIGLTEEKKQELEANGEIYPVPERLTR